MKVIKDLFGNEENELSFFDRHKKLHDSTIAKIDAACEDEARRRFNSWFWSDKEKTLHKRACEFEKLYFKDLNIPRSTYAEQKTEDNVASIKNWIIKYDDDLDEGNGLCCASARLILIRPRKRQEETRTLLHEMCHAYEDMLAEDLRQIIAIELYHKVSKSIPDLYELLREDIEMSDDPDQPYSEHSQLFVLKSLDLDLRLKKPLGYVRGYSREDIFREMGIRRRRNMKL